MLTWGCIVLVAALAEGQQALGPLQLLEVLMKLLQHAKPVKCCASCKRKCRTTSVQTLPNSWHVWNVGLIM